MVDRIVPTTSLDIKVKHLLEWPRSPFYGLLWVFIYEELIGLFTECVCSKLLVDDYLLL